MTEKNSAEESAPRVRHRILVVDDEQVILHAALRILGSEGFDVVTKLDAESALETIETDAPDLSVVDLKLPGMSGLEFVETVRASRPNLPIIVTTGISSVAQAVRALEKGAFDFLPKPFTFEELLGPVRRAARYCESDRVSNTGPTSTAESRRLFLGMLTWAEPGTDGGFAVGLTEIFSITAGESSSIELPAEGDRVQQGGHMARLKTADGRSHWILAPLSGVVSGINGGLADNVQLLDGDPLGDGWIAVIKPSDLESEAGHLRTWARPV